MAGVGTADVPAASEASYRAAVPSGVSTGICMVLEMRDGETSKLQEKGMLKAVLNIIDVIAHELLGMDVWEQAEIDRTMDETLDGTKNERCWSRANSSANTALAIPMTVCRAGAAENEVFRHMYISTLTGNRLACPTEAGSAAEDMITDTESFHTLKFGHQKDVRRDMCNVGDEIGSAPSVQFNSETSNFFTEFPELGQGVLPRCE